MGTVISLHIEIQRFQVSLARNANFFLYVKKDYSAFFAISRKLKILNVVLEADLIFKIQNLTHELSHVFACGVTGFSWFYICVTKKAISSYILIINIYKYTSLKGLWMRKVTKKIIMQNKLVDPQ